MKEQHTCNQAVETTREGEKDTDVLAEVRVQFDNFRRHKQIILLTVVLQCQPVETGFEICRRSNQQLSLENPAELIESSFSAEIPGSDVLQIKWNVIFEEKNLIFLVE